MEKEYIFKTNFEIGESTKLEINNLLYKLFQFPIDDRLSILMALNVDLEEILKKKRV